MSQRALFEVKASERLHRMDNALSSRAGIGRLLLLFLAAILLTLWLVKGSATAEGLFQSPQSSPPAEPQAVEQPPAEPPAEEPPAADEQPVEQPAEQPAPSEQQPVQESPLESPVQPAPSPQAPAPTALPAEEGSGAAPSAGQDTSETAGRSSRSREDAAATATTADENSVRSFILDRAEFIDTVVVSGAYLWLCCGVGIFLLVPVLMVVLYIRGRSKVVAEEEY